MVISGCQDPILNSLKEFLHLNKFLDHHYKIGEQEIGKFESDPNRLRLVKN